MKMRVTFAFLAIMFLASTMQSQVSGCIRHVGNEILETIEQEDGKCLTRVELCLAKHRSEMAEMDFQINFMEGALGHKYQVASQPVGFQKCHTFTFVSSCDVLLSLAGYGRTAERQFCGAWSTYYALPVDLLSFTGTPGNGQVSLEWKVAGEVDILRYVLERQNDKGVFIPVYQTPARADGLGEYTYSYCDNAAEIGVNTYRLAIHEATGEVVYSSSIALNLESSDAFVKGEIWPTPATQEVVVNVPMADNSAVDVLGRRYELRPLGVRSYDVSDLASGIYFIRTLDGQSLKLVKQ
jgi:hypothetical protein